MPNIQVFSLAQDYLVINRQYQFHLNFYLKNSKTSSNIWQSISHNLIHNTVHVNVGEALLESRIIYSDQTTLL